MPISKTTLNLGGKSLNQNVINKIQLEQELTYIKDVYNSKFLKLQNILNQPIKFLKLIVTEEFKNQVKGDLFLRNEYQNVYCIYGKIEITSVKLINPVFILPDFQNSKYSIVVHCNDSDSFVKGIIHENALNILPNKCPCEIEINSVISLPPPFPIHVNI